MTTFFSPDPIPSPGMAVLGEDAAHHARVKRLEIGTTITLVDGTGGRGVGSLVRVSKSQLSVDVTRLDQLDPPAPVHLLVPVADRERMLWLAEKATELGVASWRPVSFRRSKSVSPRGEGLTFQGKVHARMISALEQSSGAWLPMLFPDASLDRALAAAPAGWRVLLDAGGAAPDLSRPTTPVIIALGPEGGLEETERAMLVSSGFRPTTLGGNILRFETAAIAGIAVMRAALLSHSGAARV